MSTLPAEARIEEARTRLERDPGGAHRLAQAALDTARAEGDAVAMAEAELLMGECAGAMGDQVAALERFGAAMAGFRAKGLPRREAEVHRVMAFSHASMGAFEEAHAHHLEALSLLEEAGDERGMAHVLRIIGVSASKARDHEQGLEWYRKSLAIARRIGDTESAARTLNNIGLDLKNLGRLDESLAAYEEAIETMAALDRPVWVAATLGNLALTLDLLHRDADAERTYRDAIARCREVDVRQGLRNALVGMGRLYTRLGRIGEARDLLLEGLAIAERGNYQPDLADALAALAEAEKADGRAAAALAYFERYHEVMRAMTIAESQQRVKGLELRLELGQAQREATEQRQRSRELAKANERLQSAAAEKNELLRHFERQNREDALTGLASRRHFEDRLAAMCAEAGVSGAALAIALVEIDQFQRLADSFSPDAGDSVLVEVARVLSSNSAGEDLVARAGTAAFAIAFPGRGLEEARATAERIRAVIEAQDWAMIHQWLKVTVTVGLAEATPGMAPAQLLALADARLRSAREAGRNRVLAASDAGTERAAGPAEASKADDVRQAQIVAEQVRSSYANLPIAYIAGLVGATLLCFVVRDLIPAIVWVSWLAAMFAVSGGLLALYRAYRQRRPSGEDARRWGRLAATGAFLAGALWGGGGLLLHTPDSIDYQIMVAATAAIVGSSVAFASATYLPAFFAFFYPAVVPTAVLFLSKPDNTRFVIGLMLLLYMPVVTRFAMTLNTAFIDTLRLRFTNVALVGELRERKDAAERANLAKSRFLAAASHDLRQPMHAMGLFLQALRQGTLGDRERALVQSVGESFDAMDGLFNALLDISRLDAGVVEPRVATFPVARVLERMRKEYGPQAAAKGLRLAVRPCRAHVRSDPVLLEEIVGNLVSNAIRYTATGRVVVGCRREAGSLRIEVWDTGRGIPSDKVREIFREFIQLDNPERDREKGLGLGLAIVERVSELLAHGVDVRSTPGRGSVFRVRLPLGRAEDAAPLESSEIAPIAQYLRGRFVVVVDDDRAVLDAMAAMLGEWGLEVASADSGAMILGKLASAERRPDLILCDYRLRNGESGIEVIREIRDEFNAEIPAALITGDTGPERLKEARASGLPLLHKPVKATRLRLVVGQLMREAETAATEA